MPNWGAIAVGGLAGLSAAVFVSVPLMIAGIAGTETFSGQAVLVLAGFAAQVAAGAVATRVAGRGGVNGSLAGLVLFAVVSAISVAAGSRPSVAALAFGAVVAAVLGTAGGVLGEMSRRRGRSG